MNDTIYRQAAIDICDNVIDVFRGQFGAGVIVAIKESIEELPSAQQERSFYADISDEEFETWLYEHGICNPNIHEPIPCDAVPLLIDNAISELPPTQPEIIRCKDCKYWKRSSCCEGYCAEIDMEGFDEDHYCGFAERRTGWMT